MSCIIKAKVRWMKNKSDFVLILINDVQANLLKQSGKDVISVDGTRGVGYDFELYFILVLDEMRQGFPCALMITNRKDVQIFSFFYETVRSRTGTVNANVFMNDHERYG